jgi:nucleotide-binding universal stress UspA family protein
MFGELDLRADERSSRSVDDFPPPNARLGDHDHSKCVTATHQPEGHACSRKRADKEKRMFENAIVGVDKLIAGRDAVALTTMLVSPDGEITLVYVEALQEKTAPGGDIRADLERQRVGLERLRRLRDETGIASEVARIQAPSVRQGLHDFAKARTADLMVIGAGVHDPLAHMFLGDEARQVLDGAPCAVAVAPHGYAAKSHEVKVIGVAYDGSAESERALAQARELAAERHAVVSAFEAVHAPVYARDIWNVEGEIVEDVEQARTRIAALGEVEPHAAVVRDTVVGLTEFQASVDLLILGSHKSRPPDRLLQRSKAQRLVDEPSSPLLVLASPETRR